MKSITDRIIEELINTMCENEAVSEAWTSLDYLDKGKVESSLKSLLIERLVEELERNR